MKTTDGLGSFGAIQIIESDTDGSQSIYASDLDGDGDNDVLGTLRIDDKNTWYENLTILSIGGNDLESKISIHPNPMRDILFIESDQDIKGFKLYDLLGRLVLEEKEAVTAINLTTIASGVFLLHLETEKGTLPMKLVKE